MGGLAARRRLCEDDNAVVRAGYPGQQGVIEVFSIRQDAVNKFVNTAF
jgi:hypothetical protein